MKIICFKFTFINKTNFDHSMKIYLLKKKWKKETNSRENSHPRLTDKYLKLYLVF